MYYVLNVSGYETYYPVWFFKEDCSNLKFEKIVKQSVDEVLPDLLEDDGFIDGMDVIERVIPILENKGFVKLTPDHEISLHGECYYHRGKYEKPKSISRDSWNKILDHNQKVHDEIRSER